MSKTNFLLQNMSKEQQAAFHEFEEFMRFKMRFCVFLTVIVLGCYFSFLTLVGFFPDFLGLSVADSPITLGIIFGICAILLGVVSTGIYGFVANMFLDSKQEEIIKKMKKSGLI
ncbi:DUF485 domain-containing protein [Helicobacter aurati]|uniref:DUF485 domain-containing protein n=1 Tax=Helicobacter aurati TaxID=137778 RepID=A0A3D8J275_9HELI|nr:DUF485 domain-containing protein [Helicobacter aurati]RDU71340.1 DUF485 domain-containing protein [Helicobacter aurati]